MDFAIPNKTWLQRGFRMVPDAHPPLIDNQYACKMYGNDHIQALIVINSRADNFKYRLRIRNTWGGLQYSMGRSIRLLFVLGDNNNTNTRQLVRSEYSKYRDILHLATPDDYNDHTYRGVQALKWIAKNCYNVSYIIKTDDDCIVNIFALRDELNKPQPFGFNIVHKESSRNNDRDVAGYVGCGQLFKDRLITRCGKNSVPATEYPRRMIPPFCPGGGYVTTYNTAARLYNASHKAPFMRNDDVFMTGILPLIDGNVKVQTIPGYSFLNSGGAMKRLRVERYLTQFLHLPSEFDSKYFLQQYMFIHVEDKTINDVHLYTIFWNSYVKHFDIVL